MVADESAALAALKSKLQPIFRRRPSFLIIGAQKAGTTSLHNYLRHHPRLSPCGGAKELHFFDLNYFRGLPWYLSHFPYRFQNQGDMFYESTPDYLVSEEAPARICRDLGQVKLITVLREPTERAFSAWRMWHNFAILRPEEAYKVDRRRFSQAIDDEFAHPDDRRSKFFNYVAMGRYAEHLDRWYTFFPPADLLVLNFDDMARDLGSFLRRVCDFLEVPQFSEDVVAKLGDERHWVTPEHPIDCETRSAIERLKHYYTPHNERLFNLINERWAWP